MFWKRKKKDDTPEERSQVMDTMELPPLDELENWVINIIAKLQLKPGTFTFFPAYGGILLFIRNEGITWLPYSEIKDALGEVDTNRLVDNTTTLGVAIAAGPHVIPALLIQRVIKGSYRVFAKPSPKHSMSFLQSMIEKVIIEETKLREGLLDTFEEVPYKTEKPEIYSTYVLKIKRHLFDRGNESVTIRILKGIVSLFSGSKEPIFAIPPHADVSKFVTILETNGIEVEWIKQETQLLEEGNYTVEPDD